VSESAASSAATAAAPVGNATTTTTGGRAPAQTPADDHAEAVRRLRIFSFAQVLLLAVQTGLGVVANIFATLPAADQGKGLLSSFGDSVSKGPVSVAAHAGFGMLVFVNACLLIIFSLTVRDTSAKLASAIGWLCIAGAAVSGAAFVNANQTSNTANYASLVMGLLTMVAFAAYAWNLYVLGKDGGEAK
jgi:hypothetical protein